MNTYLIGYSIRSLQPDADWTQERRENFLIVPTVVLPKSADSNVWSEPVSDSIFTNSGSINANIWVDRQKMLDKTKYMPTNVGLVELVVYLYQLDSLPDYIKYMEAKSNRIPDHLEFIGYDIADEGICSGLSNCGYTKSDMKFCRENFSSYLNEHGLFNDFGMANQFLSYTNKRVSEHVPFYIYALFLDKKI